MDKTVIDNANDIEPSAAVFCNTVDAQRFQIALTRLGKTAAALTTGGIEAAQKWCADHEVPPMVVVDVANSQFPLAELADLAQTTGPGTRIVAVGAEENVELYRALLQAGIFDYLVSPVTDSQIADLIHRVENDRWLGMPEAGSVRIGQTVAVTSVAGGAGTSTLVTMLGHWFADKAKVQTLLVDYDRRKGDLALMLGIKADNGLAGILSANQIDYRLIARTVLTDAKDGQKKRLNLLAQRPGEETPVDPQLLLELGAALCELFSVSVWDIPSHRPEGCQDILVNADVSVLVFDYTVANARSLKILLGQLGAPQSGQRRFLVANACRSSGKGKGEKPVLTRAQFEEFIGCKVDFEIPYAGRVLDESLLAGAMSADKAPDFKAAVEVMAAGILGRKLDAKTKGGFSALSMLSNLRLKLAKR